MRLPLLAAMVLAPALSAGANAAQYSITMANMKFGAAPAHLKVGDVIDWKNADIFRHTATAAGQFDADLKPGAHAAVTLKKAGTFDVTCRFHPGMKLHLTVAKP